MLTLLLLCKMRSWAAEGLDFMFVIVHDGQGIPFYKDEIDDAATNEELSALVLERFNSNNRLFKGHYGK